jgi:alcohol dehydrogenase
MRRLMSVIASGWLDLGPLLTHRFPLEQIEEASDLTRHLLDGVMNVAISL